MGRNKITEKIIKQIYDCEKCSFHLRYSRTEGPITHILIKCNKSNKIVIEHESHVIKNFVCYIPDWCPRLEENEHELQ